MRLEIAPLSTPVEIPNKGSGVTELTNSAGAVVGYLATNPSAGYIQAGAGAYANGGRNTLPLIGINNFDMSIIKNFNISETKRFELRAEFFNAVNHPQFTPGYIGTDQTDIEYRHK